VFRGPFDSSRATIGARTLVALVSFKMTTRFLYSFGLTLGLLVLRVPASGQAVTYPVRDVVAADSGLPDDGFGDTIDLSDGILVVGAEGHDAAGVQSGAAYLFDVASRTQLAKLLADDAAPQDHFGVSVAIHGSTVVVGAFTDDDNGLNSGSAYVFDATTGMQLHKLLPEDGHANQNFGIAVDVYGTTAIVGARWDSEIEIAAGAAYLFDTVTGAQLAKLRASDAGEEDELGSAVAIHGTTALVAAPDDVRAGSTGSAYLFDTVTQTEIAKLVPSGGGEVTRFGQSVAIDGGLAVVGLGGYANVGDDVRGAAWIFDASTGALVHELGPELFTWIPILYPFGRHVAIQGGVVLVSSLRDVVLIDAVTGERMTTFLDPSPGGLGRSVAIDGETLAFGSTNGYDGVVRLLDHGPSSSFRNAGTNPASFTASGPWMGKDLSFRVDVSTTGHTHAAVIGFDTPEEASTGVAYVFDTTSGAKTHKLTATDGVSGDDFGISVAMDGNLAIVGAPGDDDNGDASGSAYVFDLTTGAQVRKLLPSDGEEDDSFGLSVAISGNTAIVGADGWDAGTSSNVGAAYLFDVTTGAELHVLTASDGDTSDRFGGAVAIDGNIAVVGAAWDERGLGLYATGSAYTFDVTTGAQLVKLAAEDARSQAGFGNAVAISGSTVLVGAHNHHVGGFATGAAYLFDAITGVQAWKLVGSGGVHGGGFGYGVAISGDVAVVGSQRNGVAHVFDVTTGTETAALAAQCDGADGLGWAVATNGTTVAAGAPLDDVNGPDSGSVLLFPVASALRLDDAARSRLEDTASDTESLHGLQKSARSVSARGHDGDHPPSAPLSAASSRDASQGPSGSGVGASSMRSRRRTPSRSTDLDHDAGQRDGGGEGSQVPSRVPGSSSCRGSSGRRRECRHRAPVGRRDNVLGAASA